MRRQRQHGGNGYERRDKDTTVMQRQRWERQWMLQRHGHGNSGDGRRDGNNSDRNGNGRRDSNGRHDGDGRQDGNGRHDGNTTATTAMAMDGVIAIAMELVWLVALLLALGNAVGGASFFLYLRLI
jgi:hypothetical protein